MELTAPLTQQLMRDALCKGRFMQVNEIIEQANRFAGFDTTPEDTHVISDEFPVESVHASIDITHKQMDSGKFNRGGTYISHHIPALLLGTGFVKVLGRYASFLESYGVSSQKAEEVTDAVIELWKSNPFIDFSREPGELKHFAEENGVNLLNVHLACDEYCRQVVSKHMADLPRETTVDALIGSLREAFPEYANTSEEFRVALGDGQSTIGDVVFAHGFGANGGSHIAKALYDHGIKTVVYITLFDWQESEIKALKGIDGRNLLVVPHYASDSIGFNPVLDWIEGKGIPVMRGGDIVPNK